MGIEQFRTIVQFDHQDIYSGAATVFHQGKAYKVEYELEVEHHPEDPMTRNYPGEPAYKEPMLSDVDVMENLNMEEDNYCRATKQDAIAVRNALQQKINNQLNGY